MAVGAAGAILPPKHFFQIVTGGAQFACYCLVVVFLFRGFIYEPQGAACHLDIIALMG